MPEKDPTTWSLATWALIIIMSTIGGISRFLSVLRDGEIKSLSIVGFIADISTSGLVGIASFMIMISFDYPIALCAAAAGVGGHMATRILFIGFGLADKLGLAIEYRMIRKRDRKRD